MGRGSEIKGGGLPRGSKVHHPDGREGRVTHSGPDDVAVNWNDGRKGEYKKHQLVVVKKVLKPKKYPVSRAKKPVTALKEAPGEIGAAMNRFGQRLKNSAIKGAAAAVNVNASGAEGKLRTLDAATKLAGDWVRFSKEQGLPDNLMNVLSFLRSQHGWEPMKNTYDQIAHYMKTGKIVATKPSPNEQEANEPTSRQSTQANAPEAPQQSSTVSGTEEAGSTTASASGQPAPEDKVDTQFQPTQPGDPNEPEIGDWVQVTINGEDQFEKPRQITNKLQNDWWQVQGSHSGVQTNQLRIVRKGDAQASPQTRPVKPKFKVKAGSTPTPPQNESYADLVIRQILKEDIGIPNANKQLNRKQLDAIMTIVARDMLRRGLIDFNGNDDHTHSDYNTSKTKPAHQNGQSLNQPLPKGYENGPNGPVVAVNSPKFNELLSQLGVTADELSRIQELGRRYSGNPEGMARSFRDSNDVELAKKVMTAAMMSLGARVPSSKGQGDQHQGPNPPQT